MTRSEQAGTIRQVFRLTDNIHFDARMRETLNPRDDLKVYHRTSVVAPWSMAQWLCVGPLMPVLVPDLLHNK